MIGNAMNRTHYVNTKASAPRGGLKRAVAPAYCDGHAGAMAPVGACPARPPASTHMTQFAVALCVGVLLCILAAAFLAPAPAFAENQKIDAPVTVTDDVTHVDVSKLDADTHEYVKGATMAIIEEETGEVVDQWVTGDTTHSITKMLDVGVVYILREISAPEGFEKVADVRFKVNEKEGKGIIVLSGGDDAELTEPYHFALYDKPATGEDEVVVTKTTTNKQPAPKTGDEAPLSLIAALMGLGIAAILILQLFKRRMDD